MAKKDAEYTKEDLGQCSATVIPNDRWGAFHPSKCSKKAVVIRDSKPYCKVHDPEYIKRRDAEREAKRQEECCPNCGNEPERWHTCCYRCGAKLPDRGGV